MTRDDVIALLNDEERVMFLEPATFDRAIAGIVRGFDHKPTVAYHYEAVVGVLMQDMSREEAEEWFEFNMIGAYVGPATPVYLWATDAG